MEEDVVEDGEIVAEEEFAADFGFVFSEELGLVGELGKGGWGRIQNPEFRIQKGGLFF